MITLADELLITRHFVYIAIVKRVFLFFLVVAALALLFSGNSSAHVNAVAVPVSN